MSDCHDGSEQCRHCGEYVFKVECGQYHAMRKVVEAAVRYDEADDGIQGDNDKIGHLNASMRLAELVEEIIEYRAHHDTKD